MEQTLEKFLEDNYMELKARILNLGDNGAIEITYDPGSGHELKLRNEKDEETNSLDMLSLEDIEEFANDMISYVQKMKTLINMYEEIEK